MSIVVAVVVVGACIGVVAWVMLQGEVDQGATRSPPRVREPAAKPATPAPHVRRRPRREPRVPPRQSAGVAVRAPVGVVEEVAAPTPWWVRLRAMVALGVLAAGLGLATAAGVGLVLLLLYGLLRSSVG